MTSRDMQLEAEASNYKQRQIDAEKQTEKETE